jgi:hypothetical protein
MLIWQVHSSVSSADLQLQFRYAGPTTQILTYYGSGFSYDRANAIVTYGYNNTAQATLNPALATNGSYSFGTMYFYGVGNASENPMFFGSGFGNNNQMVLNYSGTNDTQRTYTGFLLKADSGTITGTYQVYGLEN